MPSVPPFSRSEKIKDYEAQCKPIGWEEKRIKAADGVELALAVGNITGSRPQTTEGRKHVAILYFQGNGGSLPPRLPALSAVLKAIQCNAPASTTYSIVGLSYRGFWTSRGRPSERGIGLDAAAAIEYTLNELSASLDQQKSLVLWGQSIGAGIATSAAAALSTRRRAASHTYNTRRGPIPQVTGLLLETPFVSVRAMLTTIYPQKWLPYRYLGPFLRNHWDSRLALRKLADSSTTTPRILILQAENDELVPGTQSEELEEICRDLHLNAERKVIANALHTDVAAKAQGRSEIASFLAKFG